MKKIYIVVNCILIFVLIGFYINQTSYKKDINRSSDFIDSLQLELTMLQGNIKLHYKYDEKELKDFKLIDNKEDTLFLSELLCNQEKFVYKFSLFNCISCINHEFSMIKRFKNLINEENAIIIIDSCSIRDLVLFKKYNLIGEPSIPIYRMATTTNDMNQILKEEKTPFVLFMNNSLQVKDLFVPIKEYPHYTEKYHKEMFYKYSIL